MTAPWPVPGSLGELLVTVLELLVLTDAPGAPPLNAHEIRLAAAAGCDDLLALLQAAEMVRGPRGVVN